MQRCRQGGKTYLCAVGGTGALLSGCIDQWETVAFEELGDQAVDLPEEEALALLALRYFRSHSPATFDDFVWWSGLPVGQARRGVGALDGELLRESFGGREYLLHESWATCRKAPAHAHLLPAFDEYLIAYKDRSDVLAPEHRARAFNDFGVFRPVLLHGGRIVGQWGRKGTQVGVEPFAGEKQPSARLLRSAEGRWKLFREGQAFS